MAAVSYQDLPKFTPDTKFSPPNMSNMTESALVDSIGDVRKWMNYLKTVDSFLSTALKSKVGEKLSADGDTFHMSKTSAEVSRIVPDLVRELLDEEALAKVTVTSTVVTMRFDWK